MAFSAPSAAELEKRGNFKPLQKDRYLVTVTKLEEATQPNPYNKTEEHPNGVPRPVLKVEMRVDGYESEPDAIVVDVEDNEVKDPKLFAFLDLTKIGMKPQPSLTRQFITSAQRIAIGSDLQVEDWAELLGVQLVATAGPNEKGEKTKVFSFDPPKSRRRGPAKPPAMTPPTIPGESIAKAQADDDSPEDAAMGMLAGATF